MHKSRGSGRGDIRRERIVRARWVNFGEVLGED